MALDTRKDSGYLSRSANGERQPSLNLLERIALALNMTVATLFARAERLNEKPREDVTDHHNGADFSRQCLHYGMGLAGTAGFTPQPGGSHPAEGPALPAVGC